MIIGAGQARWGFPWELLEGPKKTIREKTTKKGRGGRLKNVSKSLFLLEFGWFVFFWGGEVDFEAADNHIWPMFFLGVYGFADPNGRQSYGDLALLVYDKLRIE